MSRWHREHPDYQETGMQPPDWRDAADRLRKEKRENPELYACVVCSENVPRFGTTCERCRTSMEYERLERESGR